MGDVQQVALLMKALFLVAPPAAYFVVLGLLNSQSTPRLVNSRTDFLALTAVMGPVALASVPSLVQAGYGWLLVPAVVVAAVAMRALIPPAASGWVVYNLSAQRARLLLERCLGDLNWSYQASGRVIEVPQRGLTVRLSALPVLRNVTCHLEFASPLDRADTTTQLEQRFVAALSHQQQLPSLAGSCLLIAGVAMMILPLWMISHHSDAVAEVVSRFLLS
jgi:hypothetical protein